LDGRYKEVEVGGGWRRLEEAGGGLVLMLGEVEVDVGGGLMLKEVDGEEGCC